MTTEDLFWLAINAYHEARGETDEGIKAVCFVVLNRAAKKGKSVKDIVLQPYQFSWANGGARPSMKDYSSLCRCFELATQADEEHASKGALTADHYYADYIPEPGWAKGMRKVAHIGHHIFLEG